MPSPSYHHVNAPATKHRPSGNFALPRTAKVWQRGPKRANTQSPKALADHAEIFSVVVETGIDLGAVRTTESRPRRVFFLSVIYVNRFCRLSTAAGSVRKGGSTKPPTRSRGTWQMRFATGCPKKRRHLSTADGSRMGMGGQGQRRPALSLGRHLGRSSSRRRWMERI